MRLIHDENLLQKALLELDIKSKLNIERVKPVLCRFDKGELLSGPHIKQRYILFIWSGNVHVYGIRLDGRKVPVTLSKKGDVIGEIKVKNAEKNRYYEENYHCIMPLRGPRYVGFGSGEEGLSVYRW